MIRVVSMTDFHVPYEDKKAVKVAMKFVKHIQPKILVLHEVMDWYSLSKFSKDPTRALDLQNDLTETKMLLRDIRDVAPNARIIMLESNHDRRLKKYINNQAAELSQLDCLDFKILMGLTNFEIEYRKTFTYKKVLFKHGNIVRQDSSYTAKAELVKEGVSGASGHTHRLGMYFTTLRGGSYVWCEGGCLCNLDADYIEGTANWQQGMSMFEFQDKGTHFYPSLIPIIDHKILWGGREFK